MEIKIAELEREIAETKDTMQHWQHVINKLMSVREENQRLRKALQAIADNDVEEWEMADVAMTALEEGENHEENS